MSAATPAASTPDGASSSVAGAPAGEAPANGVSDLDRMVLEYLRSRGHKDLEKAMEEIEKSAAPADDKGKQAETAPSHAISQEELVKQLAIFVQKPANPDENAFKESSSVLQELSTLGNPQNIQNLISSIGSVGAEEILSLDPTDKHEGFRELESWVDGSLDMYRVCSRKHCLARASFTRLLSLSFDQYCSLSSATSIWISSSRAIEKQVRTDNTLRRFHVSTGSIFQPRTSTLPSHLRSRVSTTPHYIICPQSRYPIMSRPTRWLNGFAPKSTLYG